MKKEYEAPKAERMEFNYTEAVVASSSQECRSITPMTYQTGEMCIEKPDDKTVYTDVTF